jgi:hypothetical protein
MTKEKGNNNPFKSAIEKAKKDLEGFDEAMEIVKELRNPTKNRPFIHKERVQKGPYEVVEEETTYDEIDEIFGTDGNNLVSSMMQRIRDYEDVIKTLTDENKRLKNSNKISVISEDISSLRDWILGESKRLNDEIRNISKVVKDVKKCKVYVLDSRGNMIEESDDTPLSAIRYIQRDDVLRVFKNRRLVDKNG